jgi:hypothetical protein
MSADEEIVIRGPYAADSVQVILDAKQVVSALAFADIPLPPLRPSGRAGDPCPKCPDGSLQFLINCDIYKCAKCDAEYGTDTNGEAIL